MSGVASPITPARYDPKATASHLGSAPGYIMPLEEQGYVRFLRELDFVGGLAARSFNPLLFAGDHDVGHWRACKHQLRTVVARRVVVSPVDSEVAPGT